MKKLRFKIPTFVGMTGMAVILASCASIIEGNTQDVQINLVGAESAQCTAISAEETVEFIAPALVKLHKSYYPAEITCTADGQTGTVKALADVANWGYGGAVLGVGIGAGVDTYTGAAFEYPAEITVTMGETKTLGKTSMNSNKDFE